MASNTYLWSNLWTHLYYCASSSLRHRSLHFHKLDHLQNTEHLLHCAFQAYMSAALISASADQKAPIDTLHFFFFLTRCIMPIHNCPFLGCDYATITVAEKCKILLSAKKVFQAQKKSFKHKKNVSITKKVFRAQKKV